MSVLLETTVGDLVIDLFTDQRPRACLNFLKLCKVKYYNVCLFHFVQRNFTAQTGDPTGTGKGGESIFRSLYGEQAKLFEAETKPRLKHNNKGTVSMVNNGENMHGSQFFVTLADGLDYLDGIHTVFGEVTEGFDVLDKINETICDDSNTPYQDIRISHTVILDDPFDDPSGLKIPDRSPEPTKEQLESGRIGADEKIDDTEGKTVEEVDEMIAVREQKAGAQILEMIGDIPDAEIKPPENVLFVCKLNPVTTDEDLEIIFSRFGQITSCEIVRDQKNGESLQYAFIEFEKEEDCERAYFKMDNVLIDDRRIHVDFSQSVAHIQWTKQGAKPVISEKKDEKPKYTVKNTSRKDKYDLVFDNDSRDESKREKRKDKHTNKIGDCDSSKGRYKRTSPSDEERRKSDRRRDDSDDDDRKERRRDNKSDDDDDRRKTKERRNENSDDDDRKERRRDDSDDDDDRRKRKERRDENSDDDRQRRKERTRNDDQSRRKKARRDDSSDDDRRERKGKHKYHHEDGDSLHHRKEDGRRKERSKDEDYYKHKNSDKYSSRDKDRHRHHRQDRE